MNRVRGEEQPGFIEIVSNWLPHQSWFPAPRGRRKLTRVGGLRLPTPDGDAYSSLFLELHIFEVDRPSEAGAEAPIRVSVPLTLRSRPSALAGKSAFIGKLTTEDNEELWVYDGARDRAFLAAWAEMARRRQGSRNGRSHGEALAGFSEWEPFDLKMGRESLDSPLPDATRTLITPESVSADDWEHKVAVDILRRPDQDPPAALETALTLTAAHSTAVPRVLGTITGAWEDRRYSSPELVEWQTGLLGVIREAGAEAPDAYALATSALRAGDYFVTAAEELGHTLGTFHADLAGAFGAYPQSPQQLKSMATNAQAALAEQWAGVREEFDEDEAADLTEVIDLMTMQLRDADEPLMIQTIHGSLGLGHFHQLGEKRWVISETGGMISHAPGLRDVVTVLMSGANAVMEAASRTPTVASEQTAGTPSVEFEVSEETEADRPPAPVNYGRWYEELQAAFLKGYRASDGDAAGVDSVFFRAAMLTEALELFSQWEGRWVFRPSMLLQVEG